MAYSDNSQARLQLVWSNPLTAQKLGEKQAAERVSPHSSKWRKIVDSTSYKALVPLAGAIVAIIGAIYYTGWNLGSIQKDIGTLNGKIDGPEGINSKLSKLDQTVTDRLNNLDTKLNTRLDEGLREIRGYLWGMYRRQAISLGIPNPEIVPVRLSPGDQLARIIIDSKKPLVHLEYRVIRVTETTVTLEVNGTVGGITLENVQSLNVPLYPGDPIELTRVVYIKGMPRIFVVFLDRPTKDTAIFAVGPKTEARG